MTQLAQDLRAARAPEPPPPPPGSDAAIAKGCACPVLDNAHGRGYMGTAGIYVYNTGCPLHGPAIASAEASP